jgi:Spy/CpxP family protein refolding chaperone
MGLLAFFTGAVAMAQEPAGGWFQEPVPQVSPYTPNHPSERQAQSFERVVKEQALRDHGLLLPMKASPKGRWWSNPQTAEMLGLTGDQVKKMDDIFQQHRLKLIDLNASLEKEEAILEPLVGADQPDDNKVLPQIDRVAQARAELEKANSRMLWSVRRVLTPEQWKKLQSEPVKPRIKK